MANTNMRPVRNQDRLVIKIASFEGAIKQINEKLTVISGSYYAGKDQAGKALYTDVSVKCFTSTKNGTGAKLAPGQYILVCGSSGEIKEREYTRKDGSKAVSKSLEFLASEIQNPEMEAVPDAAAAPTGAMGSFI